MYSLISLLHADPCPSRYEEGPNGHCYWFSYSYSYGNMWHWGRQDCMAQPDSDLVIIDDEEELAFLQNRITEISETKDWWIGNILSYHIPLSLEGCWNTLFEAVRHFCSVIMPCRFTRTNAHAHQCCIFQSYAKTVPSRMKLTMKFTMREPASMTTDTWSLHVTSDFYSALRHILVFCCLFIRPVGCTPLEILITLISGDPPCYMTGPSIHHNVYSINMIKFGIGVKC